MLRVSSFSEVHDVLDKNFRDSLSKAVSLNITEALGRTLYEDVFSNEDMPLLSRSVMDGFAVKAADTAGASTSIPAMLEMMGRVNIGEYPHLHIDKGQTCIIPTGGILPEDTDSVVMMEYTENLDDETVLIERPVFPGENVIRRGDDISKGQLLFEKSHALRPQDIGVLASLGIQKVKVYDKLKAAVISTGNELVSPFEAVPAGKIRDINTYMLACGISKDGMEPITFDIVKDSFSNIRDELLKALDAADVVILSGGSSVGTMDMTYKVIQSIEDAEIIVHGVAIKPGKPTIIAKIRGKPVFGLPGHPVSAFIIYSTIVSGFIKKLYGAEHKYEQEALFKENYASASGRDEFVMVKLSRESDRVVACPIYVKSGMLATISKADGYVHISALSEGIYKDQKVMVQLF